MIPIRTRRGQNTNLNWFFLLPKGRVWLSPSLRAACSTRPPRGSIKSRTGITLVLGSLVRGRLLSSGTCEGGTPEAFHRRRHERNRAPKAEQDKRARAVLAGVRARNAAVISASRKGSAAGEDEGKIPPSPTIADSDSGGASAASSFAASKSASGSNTPRDEGDTSAQTANEPSGDRDGDVRRYEQEFRGLSSAYGAYSSVFSSQVVPQDSLQNVNL